MEVALLKVIHNLKGSVLDEKDIAALLQDDHEDENSSASLSSAEGGSDCSSICTYPSSPFYKYIARMLLAWMETGECPISKLPAFDCLQEGDNVSRRKKVFRLVGERLLLIKASWSDIDEEWLQAQLYGMIEDIGKRGLLDLLAMRQTVGSLDLFPPPRQILEGSFRQQHKPNARLTVGARALSKHCHRDQTSSWWGVSTGTEQAKNDHADDILLRILDDVAWINIHSLPHEVQTIEVRKTLGYGARWSEDGSTFRGFLEPPMEDGHQAGWKH